MIGSTVALVIASGVFLPATDSSRYRAVVTYSSRTGTGPGAVMQDASETSFLTLFQRDTVGGVIAEFRIDSLRMNPGKPIPPKYAGDPSLAKGLRYRCVIVKGVPVGGFVLLGTNAQASLLTPGLANMYPGFKPTLKAGDMWADTTTVKATTPVVQDNTTISSWKVVSLANGEIIVDAATEGTSLIRAKSAKGEEQEISGTMTGKRHLEGPIAGPMTSASIISDQPLKSITGAAAPIATQFKTTTTITRLP